MNLLYCKTACIELYFIFSYKILLLTILIVSTFWILAFIILTLDQFYLFLLPISMSLVVSGLNSEEVARHQFSIKGWALLLDCDYSSHWVQRKTVGQVYFKQKLFFKPQTKNSISKWLFLINNRTYELFWNN